MSATILIGDFSANAVRLGYRYSDVRATVRSLADYRRALTVHPSEITVGDLEGPFKAIYAMRYAAWDNRVVGQLAEISIEPRGAAKVSDGRSRIRGWLRHDSSLKSGNGSRVKRSATELQRPNSGSKLTG